MPRPSAGLNLGYVKVTGGVPCPRCDGDTRVPDVFWSMTHNGIGRRRKCKTCDFVFYTIEKVIPNVQTTT